LIEIAETPTVNVLPAEYIRLLGYPRGWVLADRARELAEWTRDWYARNGRPSVYTRKVDTIDIGDSWIAIEGVRFSSPRLRRMLEAAGAHGAVLVAASAGPELEMEAQTRWLDGKPDEYFFLEAYGSAVVEHLVTMTGARICAWAEADGAAVLPHYSPGYPEWAIDEQQALHELIGGTSRQTIPIEVLESGMLRPKKSLLAVFGLTRHTDRVRRLTGLSPCEDCSFDRCQYRRAPYRRSQPPPSLERRPIPADAEPVGQPLDATVRYTVSGKALQRWAAERLTIDTRDDGSIEALFRYEGTTCTNTGRPLHFHYRVTLGPWQQGYPIREQSCAPAPGDSGHRSMCGYIREGEQLIAAVSGDRPLHGQRLDEVLRWTRSPSPAGCYCDVESRLHKWGLVLETIHYALARGAAASAITAEQKPETEHP
jgi:hypothetical protein